MQLRSSNTALLTAIAMATILSCAHSSAQKIIEQPDKYQWLEDVYGQKSIAWVNTENERSAKVLHEDPRYAALAETALKVLESPTRLPSPDFRVGEIYNTWQDAQHVRGIFRKTSLASYLTAQPDWHVSLEDRLENQHGCHLTYTVKRLRRGPDCVWLGIGECSVPVRFTMLRGEEALMLAVLFPCKAGELTFEPRVQSCREEARIPPTRLALMGERWRGTCCSRRLPACA